MRRPKKTLLCWSSGKDSAWALHVLREQGEVEVVGLLTTVNSAFDRVAMHAVPETLLQIQAEAAGLPLFKVSIPYPCPHQTYRAAMAEAMYRARERGITRVAFGDLLLRDVRRYREQNLAGTGIEPLFPLWGADTARLASEMVEAGLQAIITCVDPKQLDPRFAGRAFDARLLAQLPGGVDPCGENGEFHTFAHGGPMFDRSMPISVGEIVKREGFIFADLKLASTD